MKNCFINIFVSDKARLLDGLGYYLDHWGHLCAVKPYQKLYGSDCVVSLIIWVLCEGNTLY